MILLDTDVLIDLQKEASGRAKTGAGEFLARSDDQTAAISLVTWMEFAEGFADPDDGVCRALLTSFQVLIPDAAIAWRASRVARQLRSAGTPIGDHDLWIAATAQEHGLTLVTRNARHFYWVPGLQVLSYA